MTSIGPIGTTAAVRAWRAAAASSLQAGTWLPATNRAIESLDLRERPDVLIAFVDSHFAPQYGEIAARLIEETGATYLVGCTGQAVIGAGFESEAEPAVSVLALHLPGVTLTPLALVSNEGIEAVLDEVERVQATAWLVFADPFSVQPEALLAALTERAPGAVVMGGMASAHSGRNGTALLFGGQAHEAGAVLLGLGGDGVSVRPLVAQGVEPIGQPWTITECDGSFIRTIGSRPVLDVLRETLAELDPATRGRAERNLLAGLAMDERHSEGRRGEYLARNITGVDEETGAIAIGDVPRVGQTFQFQFRDAAAATEDLADRLQVFRDVLPEDEQVLGALLCSCNGRGVGLFGNPHHDASALARALGDVPVAGLFCNGEIGPVGGVTFVHGFTASIAVLTTPSLYASTEVPHDPAVQ